MNKDNVEQRGEAMRLGAQSYTVRDFTQTKADFSQSMNKIAAMGYKTVQLSAIGPFEASFIRAVCDDCGLQIVLTHTDPKRILEDTDGILQEHEVLGCDYIGIGMMPEAYRSPEGVKQFVADYMQPATIIKEAGKLLMYHNHALEWTRVNGRENMLDVMLAGLPPDLLGITLDLYWVQAAGADVCDTILQLKDRIHCIHFKDMAMAGFEQRFAAVGDGNLPHPKIIRLLRELGTTRHILVEQDECYGENPFDCLQRSFNYLKKEGLS